MLFADVNFDIVGHFPKIGALPKRLHPFREAVFVLLPIRLVDDGTHRGITSSRESIS
jgi:hypothetical protein